MGSKGYYSLLNIDRTASREEIKKACRKLYSILGDSGKRRIYDRAGKTGLSDPCPLQALGGLNRLTELESLYLY